MCQIINAAASQCQLTSDVLSAILLFLHPELIKVQFKAKKEIEKTQIQTYLTHLRNTQSASVIGQSGHISLLLSSKMYLFLPKLTFFHNKRRRKSWPQVLAHTLKNLFPTVCHNASLTLRTSRMAPYIMSPALGAERRRAPPQVFCTFCRCNQRRHWRCTTTCRISASSLFHN